MTNTLSTIAFTNEKGNVSVKTRDVVRKQILDKVVKTLASDEQLAQAKLNVNGGVSIPVAVDKTTGNVIYAHFELAVSTRTPDTKVERKKSTKGKAKTETVEQIELFATPESGKSDETDSEVAE